MTNAVMTLQGFGVAFGEKVVLSSVDLEIPERETTILLGPSGTGKSTLLRTLAGYNDANPNLRTWGQADFEGRPVIEGERPALVSQNARLMMSTVLQNIVHELPERKDLTVQQQRELAQRLLEEAGLTELVSRLDEPVMNLTLAQQRHLAIMRVAASGNRLVFMDEPTTGLNDQEAARLLGYINAESSRRAMLVVLHNLAHAKQLGSGQTALLAGGLVQEAASTDAFFASQKSEAAKAFVRTGSCAVPAPDADPETLDPDMPPPPPIPKEAREYVSDSFGPRGFLWLKKGQLAGTPRPGIVQKIDYDLQGLKRVGVSCLVSLTEREPDFEDLKKYEIANIWSPIPDMGAPSMTQAASICQDIERNLQQGEVVAVHCRAGLGRTGTILATYLIWEGADALTALETVRRVEPRWVQSEEQVDFLESFASMMREREPSSGNDIKKAI